MGLFLIVLFLATFIPKFLIDMVYGQYQWVRRRKGGLWLTHSGFWVRDELLMNDYLIEVFKADGWKFEDYRHKPMKLQIVNTK